MYEFQQKRKIVNIVFQSCVIVTLAFMLIAPLFGAWFHANTKLYSDISTVMILITVCVTFVFSRYKKSGLFVDRMAAEINDCGYYITAMQAEHPKEYETQVFNSLREDLFTVHTDVQLSQRDFSFKAVKKKEIIYFATRKKLTKEDFFAYSDTVSADVSYSNVRQKQCVILCIAADKIEEEVLPYSKMTTVLGKTMIFPVLIETGSHHAYFFYDKTAPLGFAVRHLFGYSDGVIPDAAKWKEQLPFQKELEKKMLLFSIKDYREGRFNPRS